MVLLSACVGYCKELAGHCAAKGARGQQQLAGEDAMCGLVQGARGQQQLAGEDAMCGLVQICSVGIRVTGAQRKVGPTLPGVGAGGGSGLALLGVGPGGGYGQYTPLLQQQTAYWADGGGGGPTLPGVGAGGSSMLVQESAAAATSPHRNAAKSYGGSGGDSAGPSSCCTPVTCNRTTVQVILGLERR
ncbi:hypothetical protein PLESTF_001933300 [Pleodorina starrii]|nr:hypothetical protein PLESTF_001933300 [Pleodorina starrii]